MTIMVRLISSILRESVLTGSAGYSGNLASSNFGSEVLMTYSDNKSLINANVVKHIVIDIVYKPDMGGCLQYGL